MTRRRGLAAAMMAAALVVAPGGAPGPQARAQAPSSTAPTVRLSVPVTNRDTCECLRGAVGISATVGASAGRTITTVRFEASPAGAGTWTAIGTRAAPPYALEWNTTTRPAGPYDVRAIATDSAGERTATAPARDRVVANNATFVGLKDPGEVLVGTVALEARTEVGGSFPTRVSFQRAPAGSETWTTISEATETTVEGSEEFFAATLDVSALPDGPLDLRVVAVNSDDPEDRFVNRPRRDRLVDNTAPSSVLQSPGGPLSGLVTLSASARDDGAGVASVRFERSAPGARAWVGVGADTRAPFTQGFDTRLLENGLYDFRVVAVDRAGNSSASPTVGDVAVANPVRTRLDTLTLENVVAPARDISLLATIAGSAQGETWALGFSNAPAAAVDGRRLPYTAEGDGQLVLLRFTDAGGWQIADVLRNADGSPYDWVPRSQLAQRGSFAVTGAMLASGEAWIAVSQRRAGRPVSDFAMFHRLPGGRFVRDAAATASLAPLAGTQDGLERGELRLGTEGSAAYGVLRAPAQAQRSVLVPNADGASVRINEQLAFGSLAGGAWSVQSASRPAGYEPRASERLELPGLDATAPGRGWGLVSRSGQGGKPLNLARYDASGWTFVPTRLDALDLTDTFASAPPLGVLPSALRADGDGVWISADITGSSRTPSLVARYDRTAEQVTSSWCIAGLPRRSLGCGAVLNPGQVGVPDRVFETPAGKVALSLQRDVLDVFAYGDWTSVAAPGFALGPGKALFTAPDEGWLSGRNALARVRAKPATPPLAPWPQANRSPLTSIALPPAGRGGVAEDGALAVGLDGTALRYRAGPGWLVEPVPSRARRVALRGVAFSGATAAFAVGQLGTILRWDGTSWAEDPQSVGVTQSQLNAVAFGADGKGWAVGEFGTILHFDGREWAPERPPSEDEGVSITSVAVAGSDVYAVAGGSLITRGAGGAWRRMDRAQLPTPAPAPGSLRLVSGLPDGGVVAAGRSVVMVRERSSAPFAYSSQPLEGIAVALSAFRDADGSARAFLSLAPSVSDDNGNDTRDIGGFPSGDGSLMRQTGDGWQDLSRTQYAGQKAGGEGAIRPDPVLAVAAAPGGGSAWAVGGYAGTRTAAQLGTDAILAARPPGWRTSTIWRYDTGGSAVAPGLTAAEVQLPAVANTVGFAYFSAPMCRRLCRTARDAQPDVNLKAATRQIAAFGAQPGGPSFAVLGGNARGPIEESDYAAGTGAFDFGALGGLLAPLGKMPLYAAYGPRDAVPTLPDAADPWAEAFAQAPAPFGRGAAPPAVTPVSSGAPSGSVKRYYAFDAAQNGGKLRMIVLDNAAGSLESSSPGQSEWLDEQVADGKRLGLPMVVVVARPLRNTADGAASDGDRLASKLADNGILAVFSTSGSNYRSQINRRARVPETTDPVFRRIPEYEGAALGYQQAQNNGVLWYSVSVDTVARTLDVKAIPVVDSLAIRPLAGLSADRSSTLQFEAVGRRPTGSLATTPDEDTFPGFDSYVSIPATCSGCVAPSYAFTSADPTIGDFVTPSGPGSRFPKLDAAGRPTPSPTSGLFCAFNTGTTTISVTSGLLSSSLPVTVRTGDIGRPCGTVFREGVGRRVLVPSTRQVGRAAAPPGAGAPTPPPPAAATPAGSDPPLDVVPPPPPLLPPTPSITPVTPVPKTAKAPPPPPPAPLPTIFEAALPPSTLNVVPPAPVVAVPPIPPVSTPIPPGGSASAQAAARRKEKAVKQASQSAFSARPSGTSSEDFFYPVLGVVSLLALLLTAGGIGAGPRARPAPLLLRVDRRRPYGIDRRRS